VRSLLTRFLALMLRLFFRRIDVRGEQNVPLGQPVLFAVNHPNGLVDPLFLVCYAPRPISFLAKAPLFRMPLIGFFVRRLDAIPVYRKSDALDPALNRRMFDATRALLARGGSIAIFPEGTTHSDPALRRLKTGAARIALGAAASSNTPGGVLIIPTGIYYSSKETFRSDALVSFGPPIPVAAEWLDEHGEPAPQSVERLTEAIADGIRGVTLEADSHEALDLVARAERIFSSAAAGSESVAGELDLRRRFIDGYRALRERDPERLALLASKIEQFEAELAQARLELEELRIPRPGSTRRFAMRALLFLLAALPIVAAGVALNYLPYKLIGWLSQRIAHGEDEVVATIKFVAAMVFYPLTWLLWGVLVGWPLGIPYGALTVVVSALTGYGAVMAVERLDHVIGRTRAALRLASERDLYLQLVAEREAIRAAIVSVAAELERPTAPSPI
jgi:glycerol-3-phosphate O-acyltransferase/dihydroxyacetone phosphate acyltransferase